MKTRNDAKSKNKRVKKKMLKRTHLSNFTTTLRSLRSQQTSFCLARFWYKPVMPGHFVVIYLRPLNFAR